MALLMRYRLRLCINLKRNRHIPWALAGKAERVEELHFALGARPIKYRFEASQWQAWT
jgi:hypothetical protein